jgi:hypothetical protein
VRVRGIAGVPPALENPSAAAEIAGKGDRDGCGPKSVAPRRAP